jgi:hypothetical protein
MTRIYDLAIGRWTKHETTAEEVEKLRKLLIGQPKVNKSAHDSIWWDATIYDYPEMDKDGWHMCHIYLAPFTRSIWRYGKRVEINVKVSNEDAITDIDCNCIDCYL